MSIPFHKIPNVELIVYSKLLLFKVSCELVCDLYVIFHKPFCFFQPNFGVLFDIDGVVARGSTPLPAAIKGLHKLTDGEGNFTVPVAFVTNGCNKSADKAKALTQWTGIKVNILLLFICCLFAFKHIS